MVAACNYNIIKIGMSHQIARLRYAPLSKMKGVLDGLNQCNLRLVNLLQLWNATILNLRKGRGADATQYTVKWIHDSIVELSRLDREMKPAAILQMAYVMTMTHSFVNCPETLINEKERFQMISIELRKQVRF